MPEPLFMLSVKLDPRSLVQLGRDRHLPLRQVDAGYLVHCWLDETFGPGVVRPFALEAPDPVHELAGRWVQVLGYTPLDDRELRERARLANPTNQAAGVWDRFSVKPMPDQWRGSRKLVFSVRVCPTVRFGKGSRRSHGGEADVFIARANEEGAGPLRRAEVYAGWLRERLERDNAATVGEVVMERFQLARMLRRRQGRDRKAPQLTLPDTTLGGVLEIGEPAAFSSLLRRGVGRHRAFGFGMLLLRPE